MIPYPPHRPNWTTGYDYGSSGLGGGGDRRKWVEGGGPPSLFGFGAGPFAPRPIYPGSGVGGGARRNGRIVGGIGGGMKL
jgi:hypothetical protein